MAGILLENGQDFILQTIFEATAVQDLYLGLMTNTSNPTVGQQLGSGITEVSGTGYARITLARGTDWTISGTTARIATSAQETFTVGAGGWSSVNGYFVATASTGNNAIFAEAFVVGQQGNKVENDTIRIICQFELKDDSE